MSEPWPIERRKEVEALQRLLNEVTSINSGSHCLERITRCIDLAESLKRWDMGSAKPSFMQFVIKKASGEQA